MKPKGFKVDKNIPIPARGKGIIALLRSLKAGESVFFSYSVTKKVTPLINQAGLKGKAVSRTVVENGVKGFRVWRL